MTDTESFDEDTKEIGSLYRTGMLPVDLERRLLNLFGWLAPHVQVIDSEASCSFRPCFGMIHNREFNAIAFRNTLGTACVGVYSGVFQALNGLFCSIMSNKKILIKIGQPKEEVDHTPLPHDYLDVLTNPTVLQFEPECVVRRSWAEDCTKQALRFLARHELVHMAHGHLDYLAAQGGTSYFAEVGWNASTGLAIFERQVLEFDADCCAALWWCGVFLERWFAQNGYTNIRSISDQVVDMKIIPEIAIAFFQWSFSVSALFRLFGDAGFDGDDLKANGYPPLQATPDYRIAHGNRSCSRSLEFTFSCWNFKCGLEWVRCGRKKHGINYGFRSTSHRPSRCSWKCGQRSCK